MPRFRREASKRRLYKPNDTHWNIEGNALAVEMLMHKLGGERAGLLDKIER